MAMITNDWLTALGGEFLKPYYRQLFEFVKNEYDTTVVFPPADDIFNAFHLTPLSKVKVVIIGQDPYHNVGQAHGLCFSVKPDVEIPPSLVNIYKELEATMGCYIPNNGYLIKWAKQGVLLLNAVLTVEENKPGSHANKGWEIFTDHIIELLNQKLTEQRAKAKLLDLKIAKETKEVVKTEVLEKSLMLIFNQLFQNLAELPSTYIDDVVTIIKTSETPKEQTVKFLTDKIIQ